MKKTTKAWLITAAALVLVGCVIFGSVMTVLGWDFMKLSTVEYETNRYELDENYENIYVKATTANLNFDLSEDSKTSVVCYEAKKMNHSVTVRGDTLYIEEQNNREWYEHIGISFGIPKSTVYLPAKEYNSLTLKTTTGKIDVEDISAEKLKLSVLTGKVTVDNVKCSGDIKIDVSTGKTIISNTWCHSLQSKGTTGDVTLEGVIAEDELSVKRSTGNIKFDHSDAAEIYAQTDTGDVTGTLLSNKVFIAETDTGKVDIPRTTGGGICEVETDTGDIRLKVE